MTRVFVSELSVSLAAIVLKMHIGDLNQDLKCTGVEPKRLEMSEL